MQRDPSADYELLQPVGVGGNTVVYRANAKAVNRIVAVKVIDLEKHPSSLEDICREIQVMKLCDHPNIVDYYTSFVREAKLWIVMGYLEAGSCLDIMRYAYPSGFDEIAIATILKQVLEGLVYFHEHGQIHRDIKAGNIMVAATGLVQIGDLGVAVALQVKTDMHNVRVGTPCWMAPEIISKKVPYNALVDIWSFGITAIELFKGEAPFFTQPVAEVLTKVLSPEPLNVEELLGPRASPMFRDMIARCLEKDVGQRPSASRLLQHEFFQAARSQSYLVENMLKNLPQLHERGLTKCVPLVADWPATEAGSWWNFGDDDKLSIGKSGSRGSLVQSNGFLAASEGGDRLTPLVPLNTDRDIHAPSGPHTDGGHHAPASSQLLRAASTAQMEGIAAHVQASGSRPPVHSVSAVSAASPTTHDDELRLGQQLLQQQLEQANMKMLQEKRGSTSGLVGAPTKIQPTSPPPAGTLSISSPNTGRPEGNAAAVLGPATATKRQSSHDNLRDMASPAPGNGHPVTITASPSAPALTGASTASLGNALRPNPPETSVRIPSFSNLEHPHETPESSSHRSGPPRQLQRAQTVGTLLKNPTGPLPGEISAPVTGSTEHTIAHQAELLSGGATSASGQESGSDTKRQPRSRGREKRLLSEPILDGLPLAKPVEKKIVGRFVVEADTNTPEKLPPASQTEPLRPVKKNNQRSDGTPTMGRANKPGLRKGRTGSVVDRDDDGSGRPESSNDIKQQLAMLMESNAQILARLQRQEQEKEHLLQQRHSELERQHAMQISHIAAQMRGVLPVTLDPVGLLAALHTMMTQVPLLLQENERLRLENAQARQEDSVHINEDVAPAREAMSALFQHLQMPTRSAVAPTKPAAGGMSNPGSAYPGSSLPASGMPSGMPSAIPSAAPSTAVSGYTSAAATPGPSVKRPQSGIYHMLPGQGPQSTPPQGVTPLGMTPQGAPNSFNLPGGLAGVPHVVNAHVASHGSSAPSSVLPGTGASFPAAGAMGPPPSASAVAAPVASNTSGVSVPYSASAPVIGAGSAGAVAPFGPPLTATTSTSSLNASVTTLGGSIPSAAPPAAVSNVPAATGSPATGPAQAINVTPPTPLAGTTAGAPTPSGPVITGIVPSPSAATAATGAAPAMSLGAALGAAPIPGAQTLYFIQPPGGGPPVYIAPSHLSSLPPGTVVYAQPVVATAGGAAVPTGGTPSVPATPTNPTPPTAGAQTAS